MDLIEATSFEFLALTYLNIVPILMTLICRIPKPAPQFLSEVNELRTIASSVCSEILLVGEINIRLDSSLTAVVLSVLHCIEFRQHVDSLLTLRVIF